ncbi:hypothetical protein [Streptomyces sp. NPDC004376]
MTLPRKTRVRLRTLPVAVPVAVAVLLTGCGTERAGDTTGANPPAQPTPTAVSTPRAQTDFPCPGESAVPTTPAATTPTAAASPPDHYAENHGFRVPLKLHGENRCKGIAAVARVTSALEPLRKRGDFAPDGVRDALTRLGYSADAVRAYQNGPTGVGFLVDIGVSPWCLEGTMTTDSTQADAFGGYPDGSHCEPPSGGH